MGYYIANISVSIYAPDDQDAVRKAESIQKCVPGAYIDKLTELNGKSFFNRYRHIDFTNILKQLNPKSQNKT